MTFPAVPRDLVTEIFVNGAWTDISTSVRETVGVLIGRGRHNYSGVIDPSSCALSLLNPTGDFSPRCPTGIYYGSFNRNTPLRVSLNRGIDQFTRSVSNGWGSSPAHGAWTTVLGSGGVVQASDYQVAGDVGTMSIPVANGYRIALLPGASYRDIDYAGQVTVPFTDVTGAAIYPMGLIVRAASATDFVYATVRVNTDETVAVAIFHFDGTVIAAETTVAGLTHNTATALKLRVSAEGHTFRAKVWQGSAEPHDWQTSGHFARNSAAGQLGVIGLVLTGNTNAKPIVFSYDNLAWRQPRFHGEISSIKPGWDPSQRLVWSDIEAAGIKRRLGSHTSPLISTLRRGNTRSNPTPVGYWPCEEGASATSIASDVGGPPMVVTGTTTFASYAGIPASLPLPTLKAATWDSNGLPVYTAPSPNTMQMRFIMRAPSSPEVPDLGIMIDLHNTGTAGLWRVIYRTGGAMSLEVWSNAFTGTADILNTGPLGFNDVRGKNLLVSLELTQSGANVAWSLVVLQVGETVGFFQSGTVAGKTINLASRVVVDPLMVCDGLTLGHIAVHPVVTSVFDLSDELNAFSGELALTRMSRLCTQQGISLSYAGEPSDTPAMGPQPVDTLLSLLESCAEVDGGPLFEPRGTTGVAYRTRDNLYNQSSVFAINYGSGHVDPPFEPIDDDQQTVNDARVSRVNGSTAHRFVTSGRLSTTNPPIGVGTYDDSVTVNVSSDDQLDNIAAWRVAVGTVDESRYSAVSVNLANSTVVAAALDALVTMADVYDRFSINSPFSAYNPDQINLLAVGYFEKINVFGHRVQFNNLPASPYDVLTPGVAGKSFIDSEVSTLNGLHNSVVTSLSVASTGGMLWVTGAGLSIPIVISGELLTVTTISGAASPQTFTVVRSVNGVVKSLPSGSTVRLQRRTTIGL